MLSLVLATVNSAATRIQSFAVVTARCNFQPYNINYQLRLLETDRVARRCSMRPAATCAVLALTLTTLGAAARQDDSDRPQASVAETQRLRASEQGLGWLVSVAELETRVTVVSFEVNQEGCVTNYGSSVAPIRGKTRLFALDAAGRCDVEDEVVRLHPAADFDGSGFVSDEEGWRFAVLVHFGQQLTYLVKTGYSAERYPQMMRLSPEEFRARLEDYKEFVRRATTLGIAFLEAPSVN
jgi:hypothetical protein